MGDRIYSRDGADLETVVGEQLRGRNATLSVAESCTGGLLGGRITSVAGSSDYFVGGFLVYSDQMKTDLLGVDPQLLARYTAVSEECAKAMAEGARTRTGSTFAVSVTGEAGPESSTGAPVGTVIIGIAGPDGEPQAKRYLLFGDRNGVRARAAQWALDDLRRKLAGYRISGWPQPRAFAFEETSFARAPSAKLKNQRIHSCPVVCQCVLSVRSAGGVRKRSCESIRDPLQGANI